MRTICGVLAMLTTACVADDAMEPTVEGHWTITADVKPCRDELVAIDFTVEGDEVTVPATIDGAPVEIVSWDEWKLAVTVATSAATWIVQVDPETESALVWFNDGACGVAGVPAVSVERD